jgi:pimeloyl-ACP methyl ester carboxylesterase
MSPLREDVEFQSRGERISAWHYPPQGEALLAATGRPCVVMAHGISMTRDGGLDPFAEAFAAAGCHVLVFDYRYFGGSGGEPRELVSVRRQLQDWRAAVDFARHLNDVDPERIALWGTSYSGGHVIDTASRDPRIAAVISQVPNLDGVATLRQLIANQPPKLLLWLVYAILRDAILGGLLRRKPFYVVSVGPDGTKAACVSTESFEQVEQFKGPQFKNRFAPRDFLRVPPYRPGRRIDRVACRILLIGAERDDLTPLPAVRRAAERAGDQAELVTFDTGHFGAYLEPVLSESLKLQTEFFVRELSRDRS